MKLKKSVVRIIAVVLALAVVLSVGLLISTAVQTDWDIADTTEICIIKTDDAVMNYDDVAATASLFSSELTAEYSSGVTYTVKYITADDFGGTHGNIALMLNSSASIPEQGYSLTVTGGNLYVNASDVHGLFYGCREVIKQLVLNENNKQGRVVPVETNSPTVLERTVSIDIGRRFFSKDWIVSVIKEMSMANMNALMLHFSEDMGFGIQSLQYPWLAGRDATLCPDSKKGSETSVDDRYLTQNDIVDIINIAKQYHIEVIPSFDSPGHMDYIIKRFNAKSAQGAWSFTSVTGETINVPANTSISNYYHYNGDTSHIVKSSTKNTSPANAGVSRCIDISNSIAVEFTKSLLKEFALLFYDNGSRKIDIGGDELLGWGPSAGSVNKWQQLEHWAAYAKTRSGNPNAVAYDAFLYYMNDLYDMVTELGYGSVRVWNDQVLLSSSGTGWSGVVSLNENIGIEFWNTGAIVDTFVSAGYDVYNYTNDYNYVVPSNTSYTLSAQGLYENWSPYKFVYKVQNHPDVIYSVSDVKGSAVLLWNDDPFDTTDAEVMGMLIPIIRSHGAKAWDPNANTEKSYQAFADMWTNLGSYPVSLPSAQEITGHADRAQLQSYINDFSTHNPDVYTEESFSAYREAVDAAAAMIDTLPTDTEAAAVISAIDEALAGLVLADTDTKALLERIEDFDKMTEDDIAAYTEESFRLYKNAVNTAYNKLQNGSEFSQEDINASIAAIDTAKNNLISVDAAEGSVYIVKAKFRTVYINKGETAILGIEYVPGSNIGGYTVTASNGKTVTFDKITESEENHDVYIYFTATDDLVGSMTYAVQPVDAGGNAMGAPYYCALTVR